NASALYFSLETLGVFKLNAEPESEAEKEIVDVAQPFGRFAGDVKGVAIYEHQDGGFLLVSDADESRLQVYDLASAKHVGSLAIDGVDESEGISATNAALSTGLANGVLVVTDDLNEPEHTNFKIVAWRDVADALGLEVGDAPVHDAPPTAIIVKPSVETEPVMSFGDAADDPAIWVHPTDPGLSLIIGSQKQRGINVYDLDGKLLQSRADGRINNVDLRYGFDLGGETVAIVTGSNRTTDGISVWIVDEKSRTLIDVADGIIDTGMTDPYGACMYHSATSGQYYVFVNGKDGLVRQWVLEGNNDGRVAATQVREFNVGSQTEGCVADDDTGDLYIGEEDVGIWKVSAEPDGGEDQKLVDGTGDNGNLTADVEGLAIYYEAEGEGYLVASNQGADSYALYERSGDNRFIGIFHVVADETVGIDGISETDGLDVSSAYLGPDFPGGVFVAQDGRNITPSENQNFKLVPWQRISDAMGLEKGAAE
ncbi:MAG: phytase, partial [Woeseiaceae bacterium]